MTRGFEFYEGSLPSGYRFAFPVDIYNRPAFRTLQAGSGWWSFYILHPATISVHGHIHFHLDAGLAQSPLRAPYGSVEVSAHVTPELLFHFLEFAEAGMVKAGASKIVVKHSPDGYDPEAAAMVRTFLLNRKYCVDLAEVTSLLPVSADTLSAVLHAGKRRNLRYSLPHFQFLCAGTSSLKEYYEFIASCRTSKAYMLSVTCAELQKAVEAFPHDYQCFGVYHNGLLVAASIAVRVNARVLYHFISDHLRSIKSFYPGLVLMDGIYRYCLENAISVLDLGTSAVNGMPNFGLLNYKAELGARVSGKSTYLKKLS